MGKVFKYGIELLLAILTVDLWCVYAHEGRHGGHSHHLPNKDGPKNVLKDKDFIRDYEHIKEDVQELYNKDFAERLDDLDMEVFYFQLHDLDNDKKLDGLEMLAAMNHVMDREDEISKKDLEENPQVRSSLQNWWNEKFTEDAVFIDEIFKEEDLDQDGFLSYMEFAIGRQRGKGEI